MRQVASATVVIATALLFTACSRLQPLPETHESVSGAAVSPAWSALQPALGRDWHLLLNRGLEALDWRLLAIDSATATIDLQTFLLKPDAVGSAVLEHLVAAADRGVRVRILIDDTFLNGQDELVAYLHDHQNISFRIFNPFERRVDGMVARQLLNAADFGRLDHRMHNKAMIVDGRVAIVGGRNLADEYFGLHAQANFRDLEVMVGGSIVGDISSAFAAYWNDEWSFPVDRLTHVAKQFPQLDLLRKQAQMVALLHRERGEQQRSDAWRRAFEEAIIAKSTLLVDEPPHGNPADQAEAPIQVADGLLQLVESAQEEIVVVTAYLIPTPALEEGVRRAEARGVQVRLLTNSIRSNNHLAAHSAYRNHIGVLLDHGAELFEVRSDAQARSFYIRDPVTDKSLGLHAKALLLDDDQVFIGSANLDPRSLRINTEMGLLIESEVFNAELRSAVTKDFEAGNAWRLRREDNGSVTWVSGELVLTEQPATSGFQRLEDWFFSLLPVEGEL